MWMLGILCMSLETVEKGPKAQKHECQQNRLNGYQVGRPPWTCVCGQVEVFSIFLVESGNPLKLPMIIINPMAYFFFMYLENKNFLTWSSFIVIVIMRISLPDDE